MFYIYAYFYPDTDIPFYIGKGSGSRMYDHLNESCSKKENKEKWKIISTLIENNTPPEIKILEDNIQSEETAYNREDYFILKYGRKGIDPNGILANKTIGGKRPPRPTWTDEKKKQHSAWNKEYWTDDRKRNHKEKCLKPLTEKGREKIKLRSIDSVSVTDLLGNSKRIPKHLYDCIDKSGPIDTWEYVSVSSKESKRRKQLNTLRTVT
jgi:hypothetical protein